MQTTLFPSPWSPASLCRTYLYTMYIVLTAILNLYALYKDCKMFQYCKYQIQHLKHVRNGSSQNIENIFVITFLIYFYKYAKEKLLPKVIQ